MDNSAPNPGASPCVLTEALLENFGAAMRVSSFDEHLFDPMAGGDLARQLEAIMKAVRAADAAEVIRCQRPRFALLGADAEARMKFALARKQAHQAVANAARAAEQTAMLLQLLEKAEHDVTVDAKRLADVAAMADQLASRLVPPAGPQDVELRGRFERRRAHLSSLRAANVLALSQVPQAVLHHRRLLERFGEMKMVLFPVWEHHALTLLQSPRATAQLADALAEASRAMGASLLSGLERAA